MKIKKLVTLLLALVMIFALAACGDNANNNANNTPGGNDAPGNNAPGGSTPGGAGSVGIDSNDPANTDTSDDTLVVVLASEPSSLWGAPDGKVENETQIVNNALMDTLVKVDKETGDVLPNLATDWEWVDETHCKFILREGVTMTDGTPLVADDVVYTVGIWVERSASNDTGMYIVGATKDDDMTVTIEFNTVAPDLLAMLSWSNFGIASEDEVNAAGGLDAVGRKPVVGCGRYIFKEWVNGQSITLERNENYWDDSYTGYFKTIKFTFTNDAAAREMAVESGDADVAADMPVSQAATYVGKDNVNVVIHPFGQVMHLWYNMGEKAGATKDLRVRQAIEKALNLDAMSAVATGGYGGVAYGYFPADSKYYNAVYTAEEMAVDVEGAKALLAEAGYADGLELSILGTQDSVPLYTVIQASLRDVGINLTIDTPDTAQFVMGANGGDYDLIVVGDYADFRYPPLMMSLRWANINTFKIGGPQFTTEEIENAIYAGIEEPDAAKAKQMFGELEQKLKEEVFLTNICPEMKAVVTAGDLKGYTSIERGFLDVTNFYR